MTCEDLRDSYELYSLGLLEGEEKREVEAHLERNCAVCQKYLRDALGVNALMLSQVQEVVPPSRLRRRVMSSVGRERAGWIWVLALAAGCSLIVTLWLSLQKRTADRELAGARLIQQQAVAERDQLDQVFTFLNQPETRQMNFGQGQSTPPRGNFFLNPRMGVLLIASNLPALPSGKTYELWVIPKGGAPHPGGLFLSGPQNSAMHIFSGAVDPDVTLTVTVEPQSGSPAPTSNVLFSAAF
jgi:anti-sigma-K factor RskA